MVKSLLDQESRVVSVNGPGGLWDLQVALIARCMLVAALSNTALPWVLQVTHAIRPFRRLRRCQALWYNPARAGGRVCAAAAPTSNLQLCPG
jgi:hypothetical protein